MILQGNIKLKWFRVKTNKDKWKCKWFLKFSLSKEISKVFSLNKLNLENFTENSLGFSRNSIFSYALGTTCFKVVSEQGKDEVI